MKKWTWALIVLAVFLAGTAFAKELTVQKKAGDYAVSIRMDKNPPVVGANDVEIAVSDASGKAVTDAKVLVVASMAAMPGMPAAETKTEAKPAGGKYQAKVDITMAGPWTVSVRITRDGKTATTKFTADAQ